MRLMETHGHEFRAGDTVTVDTAYIRQYKTREVAPKLIQGTVLIDETATIKVTVGYGQKIHSGHGVLVAVGGSERWFGLEPRCQVYRGNGQRWFFVSTTRAIDPKNNVEVTCGKCLKGNTRAD